MRGKTLGFRYLLGLRKCHIKKTPHGLFRGNLRKHENPQDFGDFELRNPGNPRKFTILGDFELRKSPIPKKSCFLNGRY
jgi:hypothetical protein